MAAIHETADLQRAPRLPEHVAQGRRAEKGADLVLHGRNRFAGKAVVVAGELVLPEAAHDRIAAVGEQPLAVRVVGEQTGKTEQG